MLVADLRREYGVDLLGADARMGWTAFRVLVEGLTPESVFLRARQSVPVDGQDAEHVWRHFMAGVPRKG